MRNSELYRAKVFVPKGRDGKRSQLGRVSRTVFSSAGTHVVGVTVKRPDIAGMVRRSDAFVALDSFEPCDGGMLVTDAKDGMDDRAKKRLRLDWDSCVMWVGMDVETKGGESLGMVADVMFDDKTGEVTSFLVGDGTVAQRLVGGIEVPPSMLVGRKGRVMVVADKARSLEPTGGWAKRAGETTAMLGDMARKGAKTTARRLANQDGRAIEEGSKLVRRGIGRTTGMFKAFKDEYKKASR